MTNPNFKLQIISKLEDFFKHLNKSSKKLDFEYLDKCLVDLEYYFEILTNYIQDERLNIDLEALIITSQTELRLSHAENLFSSTKSEFREIRSLVSQSEKNKFITKELILKRFDGYISPKIIWLFEDDKTIEITALKHLYETGGLK